MNEPDAHADTTRSDGGDQGLLRRFPNPGFRLGRLLLTRCRQAGGHPWIDDAVSNDRDGNDYRAVAIRPSARKQTDRRGGTALVIGWRK